tara:strand:- start:128 stop:520 length:393 start_codon:yes stop_codon:yes gene_type:complete
MGKALDYWETDLLTPSRGSLRQQHYDPRLAVGHMHVCARWINAERDSMPLAPLLHFAFKLADAYHLKRKIWRNIAHFLPGRKELRNPLTFLECADEENPVRLRCNGVVAVASPRELRDNYRLARPRYPAT